MAKNVSFDWNSIIKVVEVYDTQKQFHNFYGENITWDLQSDPGCQRFYPSDYFDFNRFTPLQITIKL